MPIAIVGAACRLPGGIDTLEKFWLALREGRDLVTEIPRDRWSREAFFHPRKATRGKSYTWSAGVLPQVDHFDAAFFGISPRKARQMDPQQRILLELAWEALEDGGQIPEKLKESACGVYLGLASTDYREHFIEDPSSGDGHFMTGATLSIAANRLSFFFDLRGPSLAIDTACSSSLVAFDMACKALWNGEIATALTGGINLLLSPFPFVGFSQANMLSQTGRCRAFDASADGYVRAEGGALLFLKPLEAALRDADPIHALVVASGANCDGHSSSLAVPSVDGQASLLREVYDNARIDPNDLAYIEAHGTGTVVGDPVECSAIGQVLGQRRPAQHPLPLGSVKTNLGHLEPASGVVGLLKAILALKNRAIPPLLHLREPNPAIDFGALNLKLVTDLTPLADTGKPLYMGVNSFGFGGANAHVVLASAVTEMAVEPTPAKSSAPLCLLLSARSESALGALAATYTQCLEREEDALQDLLHHAALRRQHHEYRLAVLGSSRDELLRRLGALLTTGTAPGSARKRVINTDRVGNVFVFSGNGSQWQGMGLQLLRTEPAFRRAVEQVDALLKKRSGTSIVKSLRLSPRRSRLALTEVAQPALFAIQVGLVELLRTRGITADYCVGHSVGEVAAAWATGALSLEQAVAVIDIRGTAQARTHGSGRMAALGLGPDQARRLLDQLEVSLEIAGKNSPRSVTLSGDAHELEQVERVATEQNLFFRRLDLEYAFHSRKMEAIRDIIHEGLSRLSPNPGVLGFYSTVTAGKLPGTALDADYWWRNIRQPVLFADALAAVTADGGRLFFEIGPHPVLRSYVKECLTDLATSTRIITTLRRDIEDQATLMNEALALAYAHGGRLDLKALFPLPTRPRRLPPYPWQHEAYWYAKTGENSGILAPQQVHPLLGHRVIKAEATWESQVDSLTHPYLADHVVDGAHIFPAAGFVEMALAASRAWHGGITHDLEDLEIHAPLLLDKEATRALRFVLSPDDGRFSIRSRPRLSNETWVEHVTGRLRGAVLPRPRIFLDFDRERGHYATCVDADTHYRAAARGGLEYGPTFRVIDKVFLAEDGGLARIQVPKLNQTATRDYLLYPPLLDAAFQMLLNLGDPDDLAEPRLRVPFRVGRLRWLGAGEVALSKTVLKRIHPFSQVADVVLADAEGHGVAVLEDCRFRDLPGAAVTRMPGLFAPFARLQPLLTNAPVSSPIDLDALSQAGRTWLASAAIDMRRDLHQRKIRPLLAELVTAFALEAVRPLLTSARSDRDDARPGLYPQPLDPRQRPLFDWLLEQLNRRGLASQHHGVWSLAPQSETVDAARRWQSMLHQYPDYLSELLMVGRCGLALEALLCDADARMEEVPFPSSKSGTRDHLFDASPSYEIGNKLVEQLVTRIVRQWPPRQRLKVLLLSAGELGLGRRLSRVLPADRTDLHIEMLDAAAGVRAHAEFSTQSWIQVRAPEPESSSPGAHTPTAFPYDLIIAPHVVHRADAPEDRLKTLSRSLAADGIILLLERAPEPFSCLADGVKPGWWINSRPDGRPRPRLRHAIEWPALLDAGGFNTPVLLSEEDPAEAEIFVLLARKAKLAVPSPPRPQGNRVKGTNWLLLTDTNGSSADLGKAVARLLRTAGARAIILELGGPRRRTGPDDFRADAVQEDDWNWVLMELRRDTVDSLGIIHLLGWNAKGQVDAEDALTLQDQRCLTTITLLRAAASEETPASLSLWLVASGGAPVSSPLPTSDWARCPDQAPLWGLGRVLRNEHPELNCRLLDLHPGAGMEDTAGRLFAELAEKDPAPEVVSTAQARYLVSVRALEASDLNPPASSKADSKPARVKLGFSSPGTLRNLQWETVPRVEPSAGEVQIQVCAAGVNFRDLMYTMGLLPDEALESGYAGASLGLEAAGNILAVGPGVERFAVGDPVLCYAPASFGSMITTSTASVAHKPQHWSYAQAATVPAVFFTVHYALIHLARVQQGERVLIHGAAGGVGIAAIQYARHLGAEIFATAGTQEKRDFLHLLGVDHVMDSRSLAFADEIMRITIGKGVDVVLNSIAGEAVRRNLAVLAPFGRFLELGKRDFYENSRIGLRPFRNNISFFGIDADQVMRHQPELAERLFQEMMQLFAQGVLQPLPYRQFPSADVATAFQTMQQSRHIGKLVVSMAETPTPRLAANNASPRLKLAPDATYLVTGGLTGFGLATALWLVKKGARQLVLMGRRGAATPGAAAAVADLQAAGAAVQIFPGDVSDPQQCEQLMANLQAGAYPLRGIIHAAMVLDDAILVGTDQARLRRVLAPKLLGARNLHRLTATLPLDFFVLYSSLTTLIGNPGQASYVAANSYLEALALQRREQGLPALYVAWGAMDDVGYLTRNPAIKDSLTKRMGAAGIKAALALNILERLMTRDQVGLAVGNVNWNLLRRSLPMVLLPEEETVEPAQASEDDALDPRESLRELNPKERRARVSSLLIAELSKILQLPPERIDVQASVFDLGLDSLMGAELALAVERRFGVRVPIMTISQGISLKKLIDLIVADYAETSSSNPKKTRHAP
ncbi:SDR family NAD(P)-dependent oxidoreductase [Thiorhodovibrio winogradskyi]|nr:SDR family NAD(P)-dependent oxidoreductase [Thiorhodovibrio winogradskyi]